VQPLLHTLLLTQIAVLGEETTCSGMEAGGDLLLDGGSSFEISIAMMHFSPVALLTSSKERHRKRDRSYIGW
jgi:hypothetical protein